MIVGLPYVTKKERVVEPPSLQLKFAGRYVVGLKAISSQILSTGSSTCGIVTSAGSFYLLDTVQSTFCRKLVA